MRDRDGKFVPLTGPEESIARSLYLRCRNYWSGWPGGLKEDNTDLIHETSWWGLSLKMCSSRGKPVTVSCHSFEKRFLGRITDSASFKEAPHHGQSFS